MTWLFATLVVLLAAVAAVWFARQDPGYVMVQFHGWTAETSLLFALVALALAFIVFYVLLRLAGGMLRLSPRFRDWVRRRRQHARLGAVTRGFLDLLEGRPKRAEKRLGGHADNGEVLACLGAARAAHEQGEDLRRDRYLQRAAEAMPKAEVALALAQAELQLDRGQYREARANLDRLRALAPRHARVLSLLLRLCGEQHDWETLLALLPAARRRGALDETRLDRLERKAWLGMLTDAALQDQEAVDAVWRRMPAALRADEELVRRYAERSLERGAGDRAEEALSFALGRDWRPVLVRLYGLIEGGDAARRLRRAEGWLASREGDPELLLALGRLSRRASLWGQARHYLEGCVRQGGVPEALSELALVLETMGEREEALKYYRRAALAAQPRFAGERRPAR